MGPMCNIEVKYNSLDESRGNIGCIINMVKEDNPEEYGRWKTKTRSLLLRNQRQIEVEDKTNKETNKEADKETETQNETDNATDNEKSDNQSEATVEDNNAQ